jgi:hypothetical protein
MVLSENEFCWAGLMLKILKCVVALSFMMSSVAFAVEPVATLSGISGKVMINQGHGFVHSVQASGLNIGDTVFVGEGATAVVTYLDKNCSVSLNKPNTLTISAKPVCTAGDTVAAIDGAFVTPVNGLYGGAALPTLNTSTMIGVGFGIAAVGSLGFFVVKILKKPAPCVGAVSACP